MPEVLPGQLWRSLTTDILYEVTAPPSGAGTTRVNALLESGPHPTFVVDLPSFAERVLASTDPLASRQVQEREGD